MKIKALIANDDMDILQLTHDILEMNFRDVEITRALSAQSFWTKVADPYHLVFLCADFIKEDPQDFAGRLKKTNPDALGNVIITGDKSGTDDLDDDIRQLPFLPKPFSLDEFEETVKTVHG